MTDDPRRVLRAVPLDDISVDRRDGRTVTAYASVFTPYEVVDQDGHYDEHILPTAFNNTLARGPVSRFQVLYNHGMTIYRTPSERYAMPLGVPLDITPDPRGLLTVVRYSPTPLADEVLQLIRDGAITAMSWSGEWVPGKSTRRSRPGSRRPLIERREAILAEFGPTPFPTAASAEIMHVRSAAALLAEVQALPPEEREQITLSLSATPPGTGQGHAREEPAEEPDTPAETAPEASAASGPSITQLTHDQRRRRDAERG